MIRDYYEQNTPLFLAFGSDAEALTIHRAVWGPGVRSKAAALGYVHTLLAAALRAHVGSRDAQVLDLGCGVGGSLAALARLHGPGLHGVGITISPMQARMARRLLARRGLVKQCRIVEGDFLRLPFGRQFDAAFGIESFVHAPDPAALFGEAASVLRPGGLLVVCDDLLTPAGVAAQGQDRQLIDLFRIGWQAGGLRSSAELTQAAQASGFGLLEHHDLTPFLRIVRLPGMVMRLLAASGGWVPHQQVRVLSLFGSTALQACLERGLIRYTWMVFRAV